MKLEKHEWRKLQGTLIVLVGVIIAVAALLAIAQYYRGLQQQAIKSQQNLLNSAKQRYLSSGIEKESITKNLPLYKELINEGFIGEERRLAWVEELRNQHLNKKLFTIKYNIGKQEPYKPTFINNYGDFLLNRSIMKLEFDMLHEEDLLNLTESLSNKSTGEFILRDCEISRLNNGAAVSNQLIANLHAKCEIDWLTLREPGNAQVIKP